MRGDWRTKQEYLLCAGDRGARKGVCKQDLTLLLDYGSVPSLNSWLPAESKTKGRSCSHSAPTRPLIDDLIASATKRRTISPIFDTPTTPCYSPKRLPSYNCLLPPTDTCASILSPIVTGACTLGSAYYASHPPASPLFLVPITVAAPPWHSSKFALMNVLGVRVVRAILNDLLENLPFEECAKPDSYSRSSTPRIANAHASASASDNTHCSVAIQAHVLQSVCSDSACSNASPTGATGSWRGGVRALRDSHVKLVLRQLRHVERLNRALDSSANQARRSVLNNTRTHRVTNK